MLKTLKKNEYYGTQEKHSSVCHRMDHGET